MNKLLKSLPLILFLTIAFFALSDFFTEMTFKIVSLFASVEELKRIIGTYNWLELIFLVNSFNGLLGIIVWILTLYIFDVNSLKYYIYGAIYMYVANIIRIFIVLMISEKLTYIQVSYDVLGIAIYAFEFIIGVVYVLKKTNKSYDII